MTVRDLADLRRSLDDIDKVILSALGERARLARDITAAKSGAEQPLRDEAREQAILAHRTEFGERVGLDPVLVRRLYRAILDDSVRRQQEWLNDPPVTEAPLVVGYQGTEGAYGFQAARQHFGVSRRPVTLKAYRSFREVLEAVQNGDVERAVLPIENSTAGSVHDVYDLLFRFSLSIVGEEVLVIEHCLLAPAGVGLADLTHVHSHPQALAQCSEFLAELPGVDPEVAPNTALAAERVAREARPGHAAIASEEAGVRFGLHVLKRQIANQPMNLTRFVVIASAPDACDPLVDAKVSLVFGTRHERGALVRCLNILADEGVNLCKLESRPRAGVAWEYVFYADVEGHLSTPAMQGALTRLSGATQFVRVLGCYPACAAKPPL